MSDLPRAEKQVRQGRPWRALGIMLLIVMAVCVLGGVAGPDGLWVVLSAAVIGATGVLYLAVGLFVEGEISVGLGILLAGAVAISAAFVVGFVLNFLLYFKGFW